MNNNFLSKEYTELISHLWDKNVETRAIDLESGSDYTYTYVILPWVMEQIKYFSLHTDSILDIGSGCGFLTNHIYKSGWNKITGIDVSKHSIEYSKNRYPYINFLQQDIYKMTSTHSFDVCTAIMVINNMPDAKLFFKKISNCLKTSGKIILILPHPCFWPIKHLNTNEFYYNIEAGYCKKFNTKGRNDYISNVLFYHRPIEQYLRLINECGLTIIKFEELYEKEGDKFPDILGIVVQKLP